MRRERGRESVHVVSINYVLPSGSWIAGLREFSSTFVFLSDRDVSSRLPVPAIGDKEDVGGKAIISAAVTTVDRTGDRIV